MEVKDVMSMKFTLADLIKIIGVVIIVAGSLWYYRDVITDLTADVTELKAIVEVQEKQIAAMKTVEGVDYVLKFKEIDNALVYLDEYTKKLSTRITSVSTSQKRHFARKTILQDIVDRINLTLKKLDKRHSLIDVENQLENYKVR